MARALVRCAGRTTSYNSLSALTGTYLTQAPNAGLPKGGVPVCLWTHGSGTNDRLSSAILAWMPRPRLWESARAGLLGLPRLPGHPAYHTASNIITVSKQREHSNDFENCVSGEQTPKPSSFSQLQLLETLARWEPLPEMTSMSRF